MALAPGHICRARATGLEPELDVLARSTPKLIGKLLSCIAMLVGVFWPRLYLGGRPGEHCRCWRRSLAAAAALFHFQLEAAYPQTWNAFETFGSEHANRLFRAAPGYSLQSMRFGDVCSFGVAVHRADLSNRPERAQRSSC